MRKLLKIFLGSFGLVGLSFLVVLVSPIALPSKAADIASQAESPTMAAEPQLTVPDVSPVDPNYSLIVPSIGVNSRIIDNVDPFSYSSYMPALNLGVARSNTSFEPDQGGNTFLFAHSAKDAAEAKRYGSIFWKLTNLSIGDKIYIFYQRHEYVYVVSNVNIVPQTETGILNYQAGRPMVTLMTCWPPGVDFKRQVVFGDLIVTK
jgi:LPXTG-site transpeptidase (sortase) family protein